MINYVNKNYLQHSSYNIQTLCSDGCLVLKSNGKHRTSEVSTMSPMELQRTFSVPFSTITNLAQSSVPVAFQCKSCAKLAIIFWFHSMRKQFDARTCGDYYTSWAMREQEFSLRVFWKNFWCLWWSIVRSVVIGEWFEILNWSSSDVYKVTVCFQRVSHRGAARRGSDGMGSRFSTSNDWRRIFTDC